MKLFPISYLVSFLFISCVSPTQQKTKFGEAAAKNVLSPVWEKKIVSGSRFAPVGEQFSTPIFDSEGKLLFVGTSDGVVWSLDLSGKTIWKKKIKGTIHSKPLLVESIKLLIVGTIGGTLYGLDAKTGKTKWKFQGFGSFMGNFSYKSGVVYATTSKNMLYAITSDRGELHWSKRNETIEGFTVKGHSSPVIKGKMLYMGLSDGRIHALDISKRGLVVWTKTLENPENENYLDADTDPLIDGDIMYTSSYRNGVVAMETQTGDILWKYPAYGVTSISIYNNRIYFVSPRTGIHCLSLSGRLLWKQHVEYGTPKQMVIKGRRMLIPFGLGGILALDPITGFFYQRFDTGSGISGSLAASKTHIAALSNNGNLYLFKLR
jgi:outer membrane protein assembly factor BamB